MQTNSSRIIASSLLCLFCLVLPAEEIVPLLSNSLIPSKKGEWQPIKVCVMDFTCSEMMLKQKFLDTIAENEPVNTKHKSILTEREKNAPKPASNLVRIFGRGKENAVEMENERTTSILRLFDAFSHLRNDRINADINRQYQIDKNKFNRQNALDLYHSMADTDKRSVIFAAELFSSKLGEYPKVFHCMDASLVSKAIKKLEQAPDFPKDFMLRLARETGCTHIVYGTVNDLTTKHRISNASEFKRKLTTTQYNLDVTIKMFDLVAQEGVYSTHCVGTYSETNPSVNRTMLDDNIFHTLMSSALEEAAEKFHDVCKPGRYNAVTVTPMPYVVNMNVTIPALFGKKSNEASEAEIYADGLLAGKGSCSFIIPAGEHKMEIRLNKYKTKVFTVNVQSDVIINETLEK